MDTPHTRLKKDFKNILESTGEKLSGQQEALLDVFCSSDKHMTVDELDERMVEAGIKVDRETIEKTLELFCRYGIAERKAFDDQGVFYEHRHLGREHDHLVCVKCGKIIEFSNSNLRTSQEQAVTKKGFRPIHHKLDIYGICDKCAGKRREAFHLNKASVGEKVRVVKILGGYGVHQRLADLGLLPGAEIEVIHVVGPFVVAVKGSRVALGHGIVKKIIVEPVD